MKKLIILLSITFNFYFLNATAVDDLKFANELMSIGLFEEAFLQVNNIITEYPNTPQSNEARLILAEINIKKDLFQEARIQLQLLLRNPFHLSFEQRSRTYNLLGFVLYKEQQFEAAIEMYDKLFLDYKNSKEAPSAFPHYFDCYFMLGDYQNVIVKTNELLKYYKNEAQLSELLYYQAKAYFTANMTEQTRKIINDIRSKYPQSTAAWRTYELQVLLHEREQGKESTIAMIEQVLLQPSIARVVEENLSWLLVNYYLSMKEIGKAKQKIDFIVSKFTLSENISKYHLLWLKMLTDERDIRPILANEDFIITSNKNKPEYFNIVFFIAKARFLAQDYWRARNLLDENMLFLNDNLLVFDYKFLYAEILVAQGQYVNSIDILNTLANKYNYIGNNYEVLMKLGDIYLKHLNNEGQSLNIYKQASILAITTQQSIEALIMVAQCLESLGQYEEALHTLNQIPIESIANIVQREQILNKIILFQIFYVADIQDALSRLLKLNIFSKNQIDINYITLLAIHVKRYEDALDILKTQNNYEVRMERIKLNYLLAYKCFLSNNILELDKYLAAANLEVNQLGNNINASDRSLITSFRNFINSEGRITSSNIENVISYTNSPILTEHHIDLRNFFRLQLWKYYSEHNLKEEIEQIVPSIIQDSFVGLMDFQRANVQLGSDLFDKKEYTRAILHFQKANRFLTINNPDFYYKYAMALFETREVVAALEILQKLVLNNIDNGNLLPARDMIVNYWITNNRLDDALDILLQIPPLTRDDTDYRNMMKVYSLQGNLQKEKDALLFIKQKTIDDQQRLAYLYLHTNDKESAVATWRFILRSSEQVSHKLNSYAGLGNIFYRDENYNEANKNYDEYFKIFNKNTPRESLLINPMITLKEHIISCLMTNNRPKGETAQKTFSFLINNDYDFLAEIKLYEGIYYVKMEPRRAEKPLSQVIEDGKISAELAYKALYWRGVLNMNDKKITQAETDFLSALNTNDDKLKNQIRLKLGTLYFQQEKFEEALEHYYAVIVNDYDGTLAKDATHNFAITARTIQQWNIVIAAYQIIMDRWGQTALEIETKLTIGFSFYMAKEYEQAINLLNQLFPELKTNEHKAEAQFWIAESLLKKGDFENAEEGFKKIKTTYRVARWIELADLKIAETYIYRGDTERGKVLLNEVIRTQGANSDAGKEATRLLKEL